MKLLIEIDMSAEKESREVFQCVSLLATIERHIIWKRLKKPWKETLVDRFGNPCGKLEVVE